MTDTIAASDYFAFGLIHLCWSTSLAPKTYTYGGDGYVAWIRPTRPDSGQEQ